MRAPRWGFLALFLLLGAFGFRAHALDAQTAVEEALSAADDLGWSVGEDDARGLIVEFTDPSCPYCAGFHEGTRAELRAEFVESGRVRWITLNYVSGLYPNSELATYAAECAGRAGRYEDYMTLAYAAREDWIAADAEDVEPVMLRFADELGLDRTSFETCLEDPDVHERIAAVGRLAREVGVRGTPTWFVEGFPVMGNLPLGYARQFIVTRVPEGG